MAAGGAAPATGRRTLLDSANLVWILLWQGFVPRSRRDGAKLVWIFLEPIGQMAVLMAIFSLIGRTASYGNSFVLFLLTGIVMLTLFTAGSQLVLGAIMGLSSQTRLPAIGLFHEALARIAFKLLVAATYTAALLWGVGAWEGIETWPAHPLRVAGAFFWLGLLAFGVGLLRGYAALFLPALERFYAILARGLIFVSGVFFMPSFMPPQYRDLLAVNPVLHGVELMRLGVYAEYPTIVYDAAYLQNWSLATTALGAALIWCRRADILG